MTPFTRITRRFAGGLIAVLVSIPALGLVATPASAASAPFAAMTTRPSNDGFHEMESTGRSFRNLRVKDANLSWDRKDEAARSMAPGIYLAKIRTDAGSVSAKIVLP